MGFFEDLIHDIKKKALPSVGESLRDLFDIEPGPPTDEDQLKDVLAELRGQTTDSTDEGVLLRGLVVYRAIVNHVKAGGKVEFVGPGIAVKTLKVRLR